MKLLNAALLIAVFPSTTWAQFNDAWVQFVRDDGLISSPSAISNANHETDLAWGDLDQDGRTDLVVVRSEPNIVVGKRSNVLLMNEAGVLVDRTSSYAASSDVPGDAGFLTPTQDRDVIIADVNGDTWLDVVTAADLWQPSDPKHLTHPRVYMNLGEDGNGDWLGLRHEDARMPQLMIGAAVAHPRFLAVTAGDVDNDGDLDLYFGDHDFTAFQVEEPPAEDTGDRLLINDGAGFFSDGTLGALTPSMVDSTFHNAACFADFNQDGAVDLLQEDGYFDPTTIVYNDPLSPGMFTSEDTDVYAGPGYFASTGDLNGDGRTDIVISDNGKDKFLINTGNDGADKVIWGPATTFEFVSGSDDSFASNNLIVDLDLDGWNDVLIADVDPEIPGYARRMHIYHNRGGTIGGTDIVLREERERPTVLPSEDWIGAAGMYADDLVATHDIAVFDVDGDGLPDLIVSQLAGTFVWRQHEPWADLGQGLAGTTGVPQLEGEGSLIDGDVLSLTLSGALPSSTAALLIGFTQLGAPFKGGVLVPSPDAVFVGLPIDASGELTIPALWPSGIPSGLPTFFQEWVGDPGGPKGFAASNGVSGTTP